MERYCLHQTKKIKMKAKKNHKKVTYILIGTVASALGLMGFGYWYLKGRKGVDVKENDLFQKLSQHKGTSSDKTPTANSFPETSPKQISDKTTFPLRKGDKGTLVKHLQENLLEAYGAEILPKHGADGDFGSELLAALKSKGFPSVLDEATYKKIISGRETPEENATASTKPATTGKTKNITVKQAVDVAKNIWLNSTLKKLSEMVVQLKRMHTTSDYKAVNNLFKTIRTNGVHQTIVNAVLSTFSDDDTSKRIVTDEFLRMGLKYDGEKWALAGIERWQLVTTQPTIIHDGRGISLDVPKGTLLGEVVSTTERTTTFRTLDNKILYVPTKHVDLTK